jgi:large subunit ribosomal protein L25
MLALQVKERTAGKSGKLRREGMIPGVVYGGKENINISADSIEFAKVFKKAGEHDLIKVQYQGKEILALIKDFQIHPVKDTFVHFDILEVTPDKVIRTKIPVAFAGTPKGVVEGGILEELHTHIAVEAKVKDLPHSIELDIKNLKIGESIHLKDIKAPANVRFIDPAGTVIVLVAGAKAETALETPEQPEVVGKDKKAEK